MSYHIYTIRGIVLSQRPLKEADRIYSILTRDLGLVRAVALGVRKESSKLRGSLEPISISTVALVKGKEFWRLTSSQVVSKVKSSGEILKPLLLLERLVQGESAHPELFDVVESELLKEDREEGFETRFVAKILYELGYLKKEDLALEEKALIKAINEGLQHSHLA